MVGTFIVLEGGEGSGKSTQARTLHDRLLLEGFSSLLLHDPGGTPIGDEVRRLLKAQLGNSQSVKQGKRRVSISPMAELLLFSAARAELVDGVLRPALDEGRVVVCDRFTPSTIAYQGYGRGVPLETIDQVNRLAAGALEPDLVVLLDMPPEDGLRRTTSRRGEKGHRRFEEEPLEFHRRVREGYLAQAQAEPDRWLVVDAALSQERVAEAIWRRVEPLMRGRGSPRTRA